MSSYKKFQEQVEKINKLTNLDSSIMSLLRHQKMFDETYPHHLREVVGKANKFVSPSIETIQKLDSVAFDHNYFELVDIVKQKWGFPEVTGFQSPHLHSLSQEALDRAGLNNLIYVDTFNNIQRVKESIETVFPKEDWAESLSKWSLNEKLVGKIREVDDLESLSVENEEGKECDSSREVKSQLAQVEYLPVRLIRSIHNSPELMRKISPRQFEYFIGSLLDNLGFSNIEITPSSNDYGRDILATQLIHGIPILFAFECKQYREDRKIKPETLRALIGTVHASKTRVNKGVLVTTSSFTSGCHDIFLSESSIDGKDFKDIVKWLQSIKNKP